MPSDLHDPRRAQKNMCNFCTGGKRGSLLAMPDSFNSGGGGNIFGFQQAALRFAKCWLKDLTQ